METPGRINPVESPSTDRWQTKLMPWIIMMPTVLVAAFIVLATIQAAKFNQLIQAKPDPNFVNDIMKESPDKLKQDLEYIKWISLFKMEYESYSKRYSQAGFLLMSRIFTKYLGFFTGMILAIVGAVFIIGKIKEDTSELEGTFNEQARFKLISSSPGIIFGVLGTILMLTTILKHSDIEVVDKALFLKSPLEIKNAEPLKDIKINEKEFEEMFKDQ